MAKIITDIVGEIFHDDQKRIERNQLKPGQHIFVYRAVGSYTHHGIYVGKGSDNVQYVIHFLSDSELNLLIKNSLGSLFDDAPCKICGYKKKIDGGIVKTCLDCFMKKWDPLAGTVIYLYDYSKTATYQLEEVVKRAHQRLKNKKDFGKYNLVSRYDEDFAKDCSTDSKLNFGVGVTVNIPGFKRSWSVGS